MKRNETADKGTEIAAGKSGENENQDQQQGGEKMHCVFCKKEIREGERKYFSRQAGMKGLYHWECFISACRQANKVGAQEIETIAVSAGLYDNFGSYDNTDE